MNSLRSELGDEDSVHSFIKCIHSSILSDIKYEIGMKGGSQTYRITDLPGRETSDVTFPI